jgi:predicted protein tyrosine phosphatase
MNMATPFLEGTKNAQIFSTTAPYDNFYQGSDPRWLFVCSAGLLRSPTGARLAGLRSINARSCGSAVGWALIPISSNLINWAHKIVFVCSDNYSEALELFKDTGDLHYQLVTKSVVLDIPDQYEYMEPDLIEQFNTQLFNQGIN